MVRVPYPAFRGQMFSSKQQLRTDTDRPWHEIKGNANGLPSDILLGIRAKDRHKTVIENRRRSTTESNPNRQLKLRKRKRSKEIAERKRRTKTGQKDMN